MSVNRQLIVEHHANHADQGQRVDQHAQQRGADEILDGFNVAGHPGNQVPGPSLVILGEREPLDMVIERPPEVVSHPLAHAGGHVFSTYELTAPTTAMAATAATAKVQNRQFVLPEHMRDETNPPSQTGSFFDCSRLSTTIFMGHGSITSVNVSTSTASRAIVRAFRWGRISWANFNLPGDLDRVGRGVFSGIASRDHAVPQLSKLTKVHIPFQSRFFAENTPNPRADNKENTLKSRYPAR